MSTILPINPSLPDPPRLIDQCPGWAQDFTRAFTAIYTEIVRRLENSVMEQNEVFRPSVQGTRRIFIPDDLDQLDVERGSGWYSLVGLTTFNANIAALNTALLNHLNSAIEIGGFVNFNPGSDINVSSATYVAIDATNFKVTLTLDANKTVLIVLTGGTFGQLTNGQVVHYDVDVDGDKVGGSTAGIIQFVQSNVGTPGYTGLGFTSRGALTAGSHTFTPVVRVTANSGAILGQGTSGAATLSMLVLELKHGNT